jgi:hypothetical protein
MRVTLRTFLAYLDDKLDATDTKRIGRKVAKSDVARELIARIKRVMRRRRLTTPPASDPNDVAEFLDNQLPADKLIALEKLALRSDVHLAEVATCHHILTLLQSEPVPVPPTARARMYALVHRGQFTAAPQPAPSAKASTAGGEDDPLLLPVLRHGWLRWALPLAGIFLLAALGLALWQSLPDRKSNAGNGKSGPVVTAADKDKEERPRGEQPRKVSATKPTDLEKAPAHPTDPVKTRAEPADPVKTPAEPSDPPTKDRVVARYVGSPDGLPSVLVHRSGEDEPWKRVKPDDSVYSTGPLVNPPGYVSQLVTKKGAGLLLRGNVPEFALHPFLMESAVVLHKSDKFALDLKLLRGRVYLSNQARRGSVAVRLRFEDQVWDLTLQEPGTEVVVDLYKHFTRNNRAGEDPQAELYLVVLKGEAELRIDSETHELQAPPGPAGFRWDNLEQASGPTKVEAVRPTWNKRPAMDQRPARRMAAALEDLAERLEGKAVDIVLKEGATRDESSEDESSEAARRLSIYCMAALDQMGDLLDRLEDNDPAHQLDREAAVFSLRHWVGRSANQGGRLYRVEKSSGRRTGLLIDRKFRPADAEAILDLLHDLSDEDRRRGATYNALAARLEHPRVAVAELGYWHLLRLTIGSDVKLPRFNAAAPQEVRERAAAHVRRLVKNGKLPPSRRNKRPRRERGYETEEVLPGRAGESRLDDFAPAPD